MAPWAHGDVRSLAVEREWDGWDDFFKSGSLMLAAVSSHTAFLASEEPSPSKVILSSPEVRGLGCHPSL